jgi:hypothetical protein
MYNYSNMMPTGYFETNSRDAAMGFTAEPMVSFESIDTEDIDLESTTGRARLLQEIEDLALTCDVAGDPDAFAVSDVYSLVAELQLALALIEESQSFGEDVTFEQADAVQTLYDQLAIEVEQPSVVSVYVGPSRKDMLLQDLSEEGSITITFTQPKQAVVEPPPIPVKTFIHNSLPVKPPVSQEVQVPAPVTKQSPQPLYKTDTPEIALQKIINRIEATEVSFLDSWINDYQSPYEMFGDMSFAELQKMAAAPVNSRAYLEFKNFLEQQKIKYEVFNQWSQQFADMELVVDRAQHKSFKQVVDEYLTDSAAA